MHSVKRRTGLAKSTEAVNNIIIQRIENPLNPNNKPGFTKYSTPDLASREYYENYTVLEQAFRREGYVRQTVEKYVELVTIRGFKLTGNSQDAVNYIKQRLYAMSLMTLTPLSSFISSIFFDILLYGNFFAVKSRGKVKVNQNLIPSSGANGNKYPILGYFRLSPGKVSEHPTDSNLWLYNSDSGIKNVSKNDIIHLPLNPLPEATIGTTHLSPVLPDVQAYRQLEDWVLGLLYKHLNPIIHHSVPDKTGGFGTSEKDIQKTVLSYANMSPDGILVTGEGHKLSVVGAESHSLRGEGYLESFKHRMLAGLGVGQLAMGESTGTAVGSADAQTVSMHNKARYLQVLVGEFFTLWVILELLLEGGFNPLNENDRVILDWYSFELEAKLAEENQQVQDFTNGLITQDEARRKLGYPPMTTKDRELMHVNLVTIPAAKSRVSDNSNDNDVSDPVSANKAQPANQHGKRFAPKISPNK